MRFAETGINRRMVLKPLGILADSLRTLGGLQVLILHNSLPRAFQSDGVAIDLDESIYKVYPTLMLADPLNAVVVEHTQVACLIIINKEFYHVCLLVILCHTLSLLQPIDNLMDGIGVTPFCGPYYFVNTLGILN